MAPRLKNFVLSGLVVNGATGETNSRRGGETKDRSYDGRAVQMSKIEGFSRGVMSMKQL